MGPFSRFVSTFREKSSMNVRTVWCVSVGSQVEVDLKKGLVFCVSPKWSLSLIRLLNCLISFDNSALFTDLGVGTKFRLYPSSLYSVLVKLCLDKLTTCPNGSDPCRSERSTVSRRRL